MSTSSSSLKTCPVTPYTSILPNLISFLSVRLELRLFQRCRLHRMCVCRSSVLFFCRSLPAAHTAVRSWFSVRIYIPHGVELQVLVVSSPVPELLYDLGSSFLEQGVILLSVSVFFQDLQPTTIRIFEYLRQFFNVIPFMYSIRKLIKQHLLIHTTRVLLCSYTGLCHNMRRYSNNSYT